MKCEKVNILWNCGWGWSIKLSPSRRRNLFQRPAKVDFISPPPWQTVTRLKYLRKNRQDAFSKILLHPFLLPQCGPVVSKKNFHLCEQSSYIWECSTWRALEKKYRVGIICLFFLTFVLDHFRNQWNSAGISEYETKFAKLCRWESSIHWFLDMNNVT